MVKDKIKVIKQLGSDVSPDKCCETLNLAFMSEGRVMILVHFILCPCKKHVYTKFRVIQTYVEKLCSRRAIQDVMSKLMS